MFDRLRQSYGDTGGSQKPQVPWTVPNTPGSRYPASPFQTTTFRKTNETKTPNLRPPSEILMQQEDDDDDEIALELSPLYAPNPAERSSLTIHMRQHEEAHHSFKDERRSRAHLDDTYRKEQEEEPSLPSPTSHHADHYHHHHHHSPRTQKRDLENQEEGQAEVFSVRVPSNFEDVVESAHTINRGSMKTRNPRNPKQSTEKDSVPNPSNSLTTDRNNLRVGSPGRFQQEASSPRVAPTHSYSALPLEERSNSNLVRKVANADQGDATTGPVSDPFSGAGGGQLVQLPSQFPSALPPHEFSGVQETDNNHGDWQNSRKPGSTIAYESAVQEEYAEGVRAGVAEGIDTIASAPALQPNTTNPKPPIHHHIPQEEESLQDEGISHDQREKSLQEKEQKLQQWAQQLKEWADQLESREALLMQEAAAHQESHRQSAARLSLKEQRLAAAAAAAAAHPHQQRPNYKEGGHRATEVVDDRLKDFSWQDRWKAAMLTMPTE